MSHIGPQKTFFYHETMVDDDQEETSAINVHDQSPVSKPPPEVQNPSNPVQMEEKPSIQECEMGAWQTNGQGNAHEQSPSVQILQMEEKPSIQECEMGKTNGQGNAHEQSPPHDNNSGASANPDLGMDAAIPDPLPKGEKIEVFF